MNAEREFSKLADTKLRQSLSPGLDFPQRKRLMWDHHKVHTEHLSYKQEIEQLADEQFPLHLAIEVNEILQSQAL